jgi:hypothetical protein
VSNIRLRLCILGRTPKAHILLPCVSAHFILRNDRYSQGMSCRDSFRFKPLHGHSKFLYSCADLACFCLNVVRARTRSGIADIFHWIIIKWIVLQSCWNWLLFYRQLRSTDAAGRSHKGYWILCFLVEIRIVRVFIRNIHCTRLNM